MITAAALGTFLLIAIFIIFPLADRFCASGVCWLWVFLCSGALMLATFTVFFGRGV